MRRTTLLVALVVVVGMLVVPTMGALAQETENETDDDEIAPGERLSGVVGVQSAEIDGEIERSAFAIALERADDNATKASHIADKLNQSETRLAELDDRKTQLQEQRENGEITEGQYRARMAKMATETETVNRQLNQSNATAAGLPAETLEANGVNTDAIRTLMNNASQMTGGEVSEIARSIAGDRSGMVDRGAAGERGPDGDRGPGSDRAGDHDQSDDRAGSQTDADESDTDDEDIADEQADGSDEGETGDETDDTESESEDTENNDDGSGDAESSGSQNGSSGGQ